MTPATDPLFPPEILFLDIGDTILGWSSQAKSEAAQQISHALGKRFSVRDFDHATRLTWANRDGPSLHGIQTAEQEFAYWQGFYTGLLRQLGISKPSYDLVETLARLPVTPGTFALFDDTLPLLASARAHGMRLGAISNAFISVQGILEALHLDGFFNPLILSYQVDVAKPQAEIYRLALQEARVSPHQAFFVDDRPSFIAAALQEGIPAALLDRNNEHAASNLARIQHLGELETLILPQHLAALHHIRRRL